jgi:hypothetical protein
MARQRDILREKWLIARKQLLKDKVDWNGAGGICKSEALTPRL